MDRVWDAKGIVSKIKDDTEIVDNIRNNSATIARDGMAFKKVVDEIKNFKPKPDPKEVARLKEAISKSKKWLDDAKAKKGIDF